MSHRDGRIRTHLVFIGMLALGAISLFLGWIAGILSDAPKLPVDVLNVWAWPVIGLLSVINIWYIKRTADDQYLTSSLARITAGITVGYVIIRLAVLGFTASQPIDLFELESWYWQIMMMSLLVWIMFPHRLGTWLIGLLYTVTVGAHLTSVLGNPAPRPDMMPFISSYIVLGAVLGFSIVIGHTNDRIVRLNARATAMEQLAHIDSLTGVANRRGLDKALRSLLASSVHPLALIMFDIDAFKAINDAHGHTVGDLVLTEVCLLMKQSIRENDVFGRWGGEEFVILLPELDLPAGVTAAERLRRLLGEHEFAHVGTITASFSVVSHSPGESAADFIRRADDKLLEAKDAGKNTVLFDKRNLA